MRGKLVKLVLFSFYNLRIVNCTLKMQFGLWDAAAKCFYCGNTETENRWWWFQDYLHCFIFEEICSIEGKEATQRNDAKQLK